MADDYRAIFASEFIKTLEGKLIINELDKVLPNVEEKKMLMKTFHAFMKRGVSVRIVLEALIEVATEGGFRNG